MSIQQLPQPQLNEQELDASINLVDYQFREKPSNQMVKLTTHIISFVISGSTNIHIKNKEVAIDNSQIAFLSQGNCIMKETGSSDKNFRSLILSFSNLELEAFLNKNFSSYKYVKSNEKVHPYFLVKKDGFLRSMTSSLQSLLESGDYSTPKMLELKLEEILMYMCDKSGEAFLAYLCALINPKPESHFHSIVENNIFSNLDLNELSFLCEMSLSSFKRHFASDYGSTPGKYFQNKRLIKAKQMMETGEAKATEIYQRFGYENISNFSAAFKHTFGFPPREVYSKKKAMMLS